VQSNLEFQNDSQYPLQHKVEKYSKINFGKNNSNENLFAKNDATDMNRKIRDKGNKVHISDKKLVSKNPSNSPFNKKDSD